MIERDNRERQLRLTRMTLDEILTTGESENFGFLFKRHLDLRRQVAERAISMEDLQIHINLAFGLMDAFGEDGLKQILDIYPFPKLAK